MSYCPKCGSQVTEEMSFCPKCGAPLKIEKGTQAAYGEPRFREYRRGEKAEKGEKHEKEKGEKREFGFLGPLIGGLILIFLGAAAFLRLSGYNEAIVWAFFFLIVGIVIIVAAIYGAFVLTKRHPKP
jgi:hypothetical protein